MSREERERRRAEMQKKSKRIRMAVSASVLTLGLIGIGTVSFGGVGQAKPEQAHEVNLEIQTHAFTVKAGPQYIITQKVPLSEELQKATQKYCRQYDVPYELVLAMIQKESTFNPDAVNGYCHGYMQISSIHKTNLLVEIGVDDFKEAEQNIHSGIYLISNLYEAYGDWHQALVAYNCGISGANKNYFSQGQYSSGYSHKVHDYWEGWKEVLQNA